MQLMGSMPLYLGSYTTDTLYTTPSYSYREDRLLMETRLSIEITPVLTASAVTTDRLSSWMEKWPLSVSGT